ncbi:MAG: hypothetical protein ACR2LV_06895 [Solirubrobacteraceae bacterium]
MSDPRDPLPDYDGDALFDVWACLLVALGILIVQLRRRDWTSRILGAVALAAITYQVGLVFGLSGVLYRLEFPAVATTELVVGILLARHLPISRFLRSTAAAQD